MSTSYDAIRQTTQEAVDTAVRVATKRALLGQPVGRIIWVPPQNASCDPRGSFAVQDCPPLSASDTPPWDR